MSDDSLHLVLYPSPALTRVAERVELFDAKLRSFAQQMIALMYENGGIGLAAPQVGVSRRLIVVDWSEHYDVDQRYAHVLVNPVWTFKSADTEVAAEGCLSLPGMSVNAERSLLVRCEYQDLRGNRQYCETRNLQARVLQHEVDHLDGLMMFDGLKRDPLGITVESNGETNEDV